MLTQAWSTLMSWSLLEAVAVLLAIGYLLLAVRENIWCWACAAVSTAIYTWLFWDSMLISESLLNAYYLVMAGYGWYAWRHGGGRDDELPITTWPLRRHLLVIALTGALVPLWGWLMLTAFNADWPYLDAFTTCFAVVTTWMVARKVLENWLYWFVIDSASIYLYFQKGFYLTALLFVAYLVIIVFGWMRWLREWRGNDSALVPG